MYGQPALFGEKLLFAMQSGEELAKIRNLMGLTIRKFAQRLDVSEAKYKNWEYGTTKNVPLDVLEKARKMSQTAPAQGASEESPRGTVTVEDDAKLVASWTEYVAVRTWASAVAGLSLDDECWFEVEPNGSEIPRAFLYGGYRNVEFHDLVKVSGRSMSPLIEPGDRVLFFRDSAPRRNTVVMAESPEGRVFIKVLRDVGGKWILESLNSGGATFADLTGWKIHGYALAIIGDADDTGANITWPFGHPIKVSESLSPNRIA